MQSAHLLLIGSQNQLQQVQGLAQVHLEMQKWSVYQ